MIKVLPQEINDFFKQHDLFAFGAVTVSIPFEYESPNSFFNNVVLKNCKIGAFSYINDSTILIDVTIGRYCSIGRNVSTLTAHPTDRLTSHPFTYSRAFPEDIQHNEYEHFQEFHPIEIGNDVWIGNNVSLKGGIKIGDGAIIATGAVVSKDVEPYTIVGGVPAKVIKQRFDDETIEKLLESKWWDYNVINLGLDYTNPLNAIERIKEYEHGNQITKLPYKYKTVDVKGNIWHIQ